MGEATTDPVRLPPAPRIPKLLQGIGFVVNRDKAVAAAARRYGSEFTLNLPIFGHAVVISDPALVKDLFTTSTDADRPRGHTRRSTRPRIDVQPGGHRAPATSQATGAAVSRQADGRAMSTSSKKR